MMLRPLAAPAALVVLVAATCGAEAQRRPREPERPRPPTRAEIEAYRLFPLGERLTVVSVNGRRVSAPDRPMFTFTANFRMQGFGGCNPVYADFRYGLRDIRFGPLNFVEKKCGGAVDAQERAIFWAIQGANAWRPAPGRGMVLTGRRGTILFTRAF